MIDEKTLNNQFRLTSHLYDRDAIDKWIYQSINPLINRSISQLIDRSIINRSFDQAINLPTNRPTNQPIESIPRHIPIITVLTWSVLVSVNMVSVGQCLHIPSYLNQLNFLSFSQLVVTCFILHLIQYLGWNKTKIGFSRLRSNAPIDSVIWWPCNKVIVMVKYNNTYSVMNAVRLYGVVDRSAEEHLTLLQIWPQDEVVTVHFSRTYPGTRDLKWDGYFSLL